MRLARIQTADSQSIAISSIEDKWCNLAPFCQEHPQLQDGNITPLIGDPQLLQRAVTAAKNLPVLDPAEFRFLCPVVAPEKIICIGKNYAQHAAELGDEPPSLPVVFSKFSSALIGPTDPIVLPAISEQVDFEAELVVVIGKKCRFIKSSDAMDHVFGLTIGNDVSSRDWQKGRPGGQWLLGKTFDTFAPVGPCIVTANEFSWPVELDVELRLNGQMMQSGKTSQMIFSIEYLVAHLSKFFTLRPGDLIFTGTPAGVGAARNPPVFLRAGDQIEIAIAGIGQLENPVISENSIQNETR